MPFGPPTPDDPPAVLFEKARHFCARSKEKEAVIERVKAHIGLWTNDKRLRIAGEILLREIATFERDEAERSRT